jgi:hypothetical protein
MHINIYFLKGSKDEKALWIHSEKVEMKNITGMWRELKLSVVFVLSFLILLLMKGKLSSIHTTQIKYST